MHESPGAGQWRSRCPRCGDVVPLDDGVTGCDACANQGIGMPLIPFRSSGSASPPPGSAAPGLGPMWRWASHLVPAGDPVSLGEGGTPLTRVDSLGVPGRLLLKDERANPTGSFKDRLASAVVSRARHVGAETVVVASSGNAGVAVAAYAASAGLRCVLVTAGDLPSPTAAAVSALGARVLVTASHTDRWRAARTGVERLGWFPVTNYSAPPVASQPAGLLAYRTMAFEIAESLGWAVPEWVVVPVSRGDGLYGLWTGFVELAELGWTDSVPRMLAVERFASLADALARDAEQPVPVDAEFPVAAASIGDPQGTAMALLALRASGGTVAGCDDEQARSGWTRLAARGFLLELSSAAVVRGADVLTQRGLVDDSSTIVLLATAGPYAQRTVTDAPEPGRKLADPTDAVALREAVGGA